MSMNPQTNDLREPAVIGATRRLTHETGYQAGADRVVLPRLSCTAADRARLEQWSRAATVAHRLVLRSQIVLLLLEGHSQVSAARVLGVSRETVGRWERRFAVGGPEALLRDRPGRGRRPGRNATHVARVVDALRHAPHGTWTVRRLAAHVGASAATVQRIWREHAAALAPVAGQIPNRSSEAASNGDGNALALSATDSDTSLASAQDSRACR
jgi:transposase